MSVEHVYRTKLTIKTSRGGNKGTGGVLQYKYMKVLVKAIRTLGRLGLVIYY